jgi:hypothetical protein
MLSLLVLLFCARVHVKYVEKHKQTSTLVHILQFELQLACATGNQLLLVAYL